MPFTFDIEEFRLYFPAFEDDDLYPNYAIEIAQALTEAIIGTDPDNWCGLNHYKQMYYNLVAHFLYVWGRQAAGDPSRLSVITSKAAGGVSVGLEGTDPAGFGSIGGQFQTTSYGQNYLLLKRTCKPFAGITVSTVKC